MMKICLFHKMRITNSGFFFLLDMTESQDIEEETSSSEENLTEEDELDFYDFLEVVSDKIDNITTQSKTSSNEIIIIEFHCS